MGKWIGQHIYDLVARFRNDVYLEGISTSTETDMLVVDSNNKVSKRAIDAITVDVSDFMTNGADNRVLTATGTDAMNAEANFTFDGNDVTIDSTTNSKPSLTLTSLTNSSSGPALELVNTRAASTYMSDGDNCGRVRFQGFDAGGNITTYGQVESHVISKTESDECGSLTLDVANNNALLAGLHLFTESATSATVNANIGYGTSSVTTIAGDLTVNGDTVTFQSANDNDPVLILKDTHNGSNCARLNFVKDKGAAGVGDDLVGSILFTGDNDAQEQTNFAFISTKVAQEADTDEAGEYIVEVATSNGSASALQEGLKITGTASTSLLNVDIGHGASSLTTVKGSLNVATGIELGHASDTTIARVASGIASIEGANISTHSLTLKILPSAFQINDDVGRPVFVEDDTSNTLGVRCFSATDEMYAWKEIPAGFKVTHVQVHASASTSSAVTVRSYNYQTGADNNVAETTADFNENKAVTNIPASTTQDLVVKCAPASGSTIIFGASITIATI